MQQLLLILSLTDQSFVGGIRCLPSIQAGIQDGNIYLKVPAGFSADKRILQLPVVHSYWLDEQENIFPLHGLTPTGKLPVLNCWIPIADFVQTALPVAAMPGQSPVKLSVGLLPSTDTQESFALLTHLQTWKAWAETAPAIRLTALRFAVSANSEVLITGYPLPALPGKEYWMQHQVLILAGYAFKIDVTTEIISQELNPNKHSYLLFDKESNWQQIPLDSFAPATRSAVRLTEFVK